ncbi:MAG: SDR family NAD(P)-dependent oxidoreductase, partial [Proteobacteria bacterium]|nr:SDR family NAD(P)-dependent oxidoreductase [Pseudomonadota bacterium]
SQRAPETDAPPETAIPAAPSEPSTPIAASAAEGLRITQENMVALQRLQQQTAELHRQFLEGQNASQQQYHTLLEQQQRFVDMCLGLPVAAAPLARPIATLTPSAQVPERPALVAAAEPPPTPVAAEPAPGFVAASAVDVAKILFDIVAEKTGYPADVLELGMELDADLGIDSIKRVEILSALHDELPNAPEVGADQLGTLRTLQSLLDLIPGDPGGVPPTPVVEEELTPEVTPEAPVEAQGHRPLQRYVLQSRDCNGAPETDLALPAAGAPIWITDGDPELASEILALLKSEGYEPRAVSAESLNGATDEPVAGLVILAPREGTSDADLLGVLQVVQAAGIGLRKAGPSGGAFLVSVSRLDGTFGIIGDEIADPISGGFAGLTKSAAHEWPEVRCRALDLASDLEDLDAARAIVAEMFRTGPLEVGLSAAGRTRLELVGREFRASDGSRPLSAGEVAVLSGGARGVTAEVALALARSCRPTLVLLGRSPVPEAEPEWLAGLETEAEIKQRILASGEATSPREAGEIYDRIRAQREIRTNLERMNEAGATVRYLSVDVRDAAAVSEALSTTIEEFGPVRMLVHGAGVLADQHILDKTAENFHKVYDPKVVGLRNLLAAVDRDALRALVLFSSSTARYGRIGQVDYAIANEVLNKIAQQEARRLPGCKVLSLNWGPWEGGMVDESLSRVFANEGVPLIPLAKGADHLLRELASAEGAVERLVLGPTLDGAPSLIDSPELAKPARTTVPITSSLARVAEEEINVASCSFLRSHVLNGKAVVPMAILPEWLAHGALHGNPGLKFHGCDNLSVLKGLVLDTDCSLRLKIHAGDARKDDEGYRVPVELRATQNDGREFLFARAEILLTESLPSDEPRLGALAGPAYDKTAAEIYSDHLFHGPHLQGIERVRFCSPEGVVADASAAPLPKEWMERPFRRHWLTDPLALDVGIQLLTFWTGVHGAGPSLPCAAARYRQFQTFPKGGTRVVARITSSDTTRAFADIEFLDADGRLVARFEGCENTIDEGLVIAFRDNRLPLEVSS